MIGTSLGVAVVLGFVLFAVQLAANLTTASLASAAAYDGATIVASSRANTGAASRSATQAQATHHVRALLGSLGENAEIDWSESDASVVRLRIRVPSPTVLPGAHSLPFGVVERVATVRREVVR